MAFTGNEDHDISLAEAAQMTANYRNVFPGSTLGHYFGQAAISDILSQANCVGIRIYYGLKDDGEKQLIITGVDGNEDDLFEGELADKSTICPPVCGVANPLNS